MKHLIIGGTGSLGRALITRLLENPANEVTCLSRCELKQKQLLADFKSNRLTGVLGDVRDKDSLYRAMRGVNAVFHVAALKHVDSMEENPEESVKTNILGTINVADAAVDRKVQYVAFSSTDKAVDPVNVYGFSKAISEKVLLRRNETQSKTHFSVYRWANVVGSRGSVVHSFAQTLLNERRVYITDPSMTRFWIRLEDAADFMLSHYMNRKIDGVQIPPMKAASVMDLVHAIAEVLGVDSYTMQSIGIRRGEKMHEAMISQHLPGSMNSEDYDRYTAEELRQLVRPLLVPLLKERKTA